MGLNLDQINAQNANGKGFDPNTANAARRKAAQHAAYTQSQDLKPSPDDQPIAQSEAAPPASSKHQANIDKASQLATQSTESVKGSVSGEIQAIAKELQAAAAKDAQIVEQASDFLAGLHVTRRARILEAVQAKIQSACVVEPDETVEPQGFTSLFEDDLTIDVDWENLVFTGQPQLMAGS